MRTIRAIVGGVACPVVGGLLSMWAGLPLRPVMPAAVTTTARVVIVLYSSAREPYVRAFANRITTLGSWVAG